MRGMDSDGNLAGNGAVIITGGSRGIGAACARLAARDGWSVCVNYTSNAEAAKAVVADVEAAGAKAIAVQADVSREDDVLRLFKVAADALGPVTALINNAGILENQMKLEQMSAERFARVFSVNAIGALLCAREAVRVMGTSHGGNGGVIVNVSSAASRLGSPNEYIDYAASKGAMDTMTIGLAKEVGGDGIRVNAVRPGLILTDIHAASGEPGRAERLAPQVPVGRPGTAEEVAETVVWLMSEKSSYVNGALLDVSGGR